MKKYSTVLIINIILIAIWIMAMQLEAYEKDFQVNMTVGADIPPEMVEEVKEALELFSVEVMDSFVKEDWKIVLLSTFEGRDGYESIDKDSSVVGLINFPQKTITIKGMRIRHWYERFWKRNFWGERKSSGNRSQNSM